MTPQQLIAHLDERIKKIDKRYGKVLCSQDNPMVSLCETEKIMAEFRRLALAGIKLAEDIGRDEGHNDDCMFCGFKDKHRNAALTTFNNAIKD
jgi:hypothetical protein